MSMHGCDLMICIGARFDDRITGRLDAFSARIEERSTVDIDPSSINKNVKADLPIIRRLRPHVLSRTWCGYGVPPPCTRTKPRSRPGGSRSISGAPRKSLAYNNSNEVIKSRNMAIGRLYELTKNRGHTYITDRGRTAPDVGGPVFYYRFEQAEPAGWTSGGPSAPWATACRRRSACKLAHPNSLVVDIRSGESFGADDHAGNVDGGAVRAAD